MSIRYSSNSNLKPISEVSTNVIGGIASVTSLSVSGISTIGNVQISSGIVTATTFVGNLTGTATTAGIATYASTAGISTSVIGGVGSVTQLQVTGISTFTNGPVLIGAATSTGTATQRLQVTGGAYILTSTGIGTTNPQSTLHVLGNVLVAAGTSTDQYITLRPYELNNGTLSWEGSSGQLFSITNNLTSGSIFSVNDISGIPSIDVDASGLISLGPYGGNIGLGITNPTSKLQVVGNALINGITTITGNLNAPGNYYVKLARLTNQTIPNGADTLIGFSTMSDPNSWYTGITTRTTPTVSGTYNVTGMVNWQAGSITNDQTNIQLRKNGTTFAVSQVGIQTFTYTQNVCGIVTMNGTTDYIDFTVYTANPTSQDVRGTADGAWTKIEIFKIN